MKIKRRLLRIKRRGGRGERGHRMTNFDQDPKTRHDWTPRAFFQINRQEYNKCILKCEIWEVSRGLEHRKRRIVTSGKSRAARLVHSKKLGSWVADARPLWANLEYLLIKYTYHILKWNGSGHWSASSAVHVGNGSCWRFEAKKNRCASSSSLEHSIAALAFFVAFFYEATQARDDKSWEVFSSGSFLKSSLIDCPLRV